MNYKAIVFFILLFMFALNGHADEKGVIKGKVIEQTTKQPIIGATVVVKDTHLGAYTDTSGTFTVKNVPEGNYSLTISRLGYQSKIIDNIIVVRNKTYEFEAELFDDPVKVDQVTITAPEYENDPAMPVSTYSFSRQEIFRSPGAQGDIFRALGILPGVTSSGAQYSAIAVRGQGTSDNVYIVDDIPMFDLTHFETEGFISGFNDPNGGRFSIFAPKVVDNAVFQGGGFGAEYGRKASSYLGLGIKEGNHETSSLSGQFDLLGATLIYDGPSHIDNNTSVFASARYQNFSLLEKVIGLTKAGLPQYGDYMIKTTTQIDAKNKLSVIAMYNSELFTRAADDVRDEGNLNDDNHSSFVGQDKVNKGALGVNLQTLTGQSSYWKNVLYYRFSNTDNLLGNAYPVVSADGQVISQDSVPSEPGLRHIQDDQKELGYRSIFTENFNGTTLTAGVDLARVDIDYSRILQHTDTLYAFYQTDYRPDPSQYYLVIQPTNFNAAYKNFAYNASGYVDMSFTLFKRLTLNPGVRYDYTGFAVQNTVSPRFSGNLNLDEQQSINFATGIFYQDPDYTDVAGQPAGNVLKNERTIQYILGYKNYFSPDVKFVVETWYKRFDDLIVHPLSGQSYMTNAGTGYAYGLDINLTKRLSENYYGQIGYSYMVSKRDDHDGQGLYDYTFSQPNVFSALASYKPDDEWLFSAKFRYATGRPKDRYIIHANVFNDPSYLRYSQEVTGKNADRLPDFISLDIRADYKVQYETMGLTAFIDIVDALNRFNEDSEIIQPLTGKTYALGLAVFPSFGLILEF
ncbi:MAG TPA: TonB-dependent receptor [Candidatus Kapabacteria bacterium]|nr:TonB-dependent receptor [Candidatus Kapabacteria bacterium]